MFYGAIFLDEAITAAAIAGLVLILGGVAIASRPKRVQAPVPAPAAARALIASRRVDLTLSPAEEEFRDTLRAWIADNHPGREPDGDEDSFAFRRDWQRKLNERGWAGLTWPTEYGGAGATQIEQAIFFEEIARARAPQMANVLGLTMGGPTVIAHGTDDQKARFLSPILSADEMWCQGFSEPESGSDLASLKTRAVLKGDEYIVTGQKVWTTFAHQSKWCMLLARTNADAPKHRGLTYFLMDMEQDGVEVRPLVQITGEAEFNELFIEEARIPVENVVGGVDNGWRVAITTLMHERAGLAFALQARVQIALGELADELKGTKDPLVRQRFAQIAIEAQVLRLLAYRGLTTAMKSGEPGPGGLAGQVAVGRRQPGADDAGDGHPRPARAARRRRLDLPLPARPRELDRGRHDRDPQEHRRRTRPGAAARMNFDLTEDQREIKRTARDFLAARYTPEKIRAIALDGAAGPALGRHRRARLAGRGRAGDRRAGGRGRGARLRAGAVAAGRALGGEAPAPGARGARDGGDVGRRAVRARRVDDARLAHRDEDRGAQRRRRRHADRHRRGRQALRGGRLRRDDRAGERARSHAAAVHRDARRRARRRSCPATSAAPGTRSR